MRRRFSDAFYGRADALRAAVHRAAAFDIEAELGGDNDPVADGLKGFAHDLFVLVGSVDFSCIEECDSALEGAADQLHGIRQGQRLAV